MKKLKKILLIIITLLIILPTLFLGSRDLFNEKIEPLHKYKNRLDKTTIKRSDFKSAEFCKACHKDIYDEWKESYLSQSYTTSKIEIDLHRLTLQLRGIDKGEVRFCLECHAPLALTFPEDLSVQDTLSREGVTCVVCHSAEVCFADSAPANFKMTPFEAMNGPFNDAKSPMHQTKENDNFKGKNCDLCAGCHYSVWPRNGIPIDYTFFEWKHENPRPDSSCKDCHMEEKKAKHHILQMLKNVQFVIINFLVVMIVLK